MYNMRIRRFIQRTQQRTRKRNLHLTGYYLNFVLEHTSGYIYVILFSRSEQFKGERVCAIMLKFGRMHCFETPPLVVC